MLELKFIKGSLYNLLLSSHFAPLVFFPTHVYYKLKFITEKFSKMAHGEILSEEEFFGEFHEILSLIVSSDTYTSVSEEDSSSEYSSNQVTSILEQEKDKNLSDWLLREVKTKLMVHEKTLQVCWV